MQIWADMQFWDLFHKIKVEGALSATRAAIEEGIVPGGEIVFFNAVPNAPGRRRNGLLEAKRSKGD
jgi:hypothetical protein